MIWHGHLLLDLFNILITIVLIQHVILCSMNEVQLCDNMCIISRSCLPGSSAVITEYYSFIKCF